MRSASPSGTTTSKRRQPGSSRTDAAAFSTMRTRKRSNVPGFRRKSTMMTKPLMIAFQHFPIEGRHLAEMGADQPLGPVRVAGDDGLVDLLVRPVGELVLRRRAQRDAPLLGQPLDHRLVHGE